MDENEIMIRAREAAVKVGPERGVSTEPSKWAEGVRAGENDDFWLVRAAARALRDLSKPLSEIQPVDPDLVEARNIVAAETTVSGAAEIWRAGLNDDTFTMRSVTAAIKRGRELAELERPAR